MSVAEKITSIKSHVQSAYDALEEMGGVIPARKNLENLTDSVDYIFPKQPDGSDNGWGILFTDAYPNGIYLTQEDYEVNCCSLQDDRYTEFSFGDVNYAEVKGFAFGNNATTIPDYFLAGSTKLDMALIIPNTITVIGNFFLNECSSYCRPLDIPSSVKTIGNNFMLAANSSIKSITLPHSIESIGDHFLWGGYGANGTSPILTVECPPSVVHDSINCLAATQLVNGAVPTIKMKGTYAQAWIDNFPNSDTLPYRKLILAN